MIINEIRLDHDVVESQVISVAAQVQPIDASWHGQISFWRALNQVADNVDLQRVAFDDMALHDASLQKILADIRARLGGPDPAILYLHRGHQPDTRSPILQHLIPLIGAGGPIFALRVEDDRARQDAMTMAHALLNEHGQVLVLTDEIRRLGRKEKIVSGLTYEVLSKSRIKASSIMAPPIQAVAQERKVDL